MYNELWLNFIWLFLSMILKGERGRLSVAICMWYAVHHRLCISNWFNTNQRRARLAKASLSYSFLSDMSEDSSLWLSSYLSWTALSSCSLDLRVLSSRLSCVVGSFLRHNPCMCVYFQRYGFCDQSDKPSPYCWRKRTVNVDIPKLMLSVH